MNKKYQILNESLKAIAGNVINLFICNGEYGFGKTHNVINFLNEQEVDYVYIGSYATPLKFYDILYKNKDKQVIVFDDVQNIDNNIIVSMLKSACWGVLGGDRIVSYYSTSEKIKELELPESFKLNANIILIFNENEVSEFSVIKSRGINVDLSFNYEEKLEIFEKMTQIDKEILDYVKKYCSGATKNLNIRSLVILMALKRAKFKWEDFAKEMLLIDEEKQLIIDLVSKCHRLEYACRKWIKATGKSRRTFFRYYNQLNLNRRNQNGYKK